MRELAIVVEGQNREKAYRDVEKAITDAVGRGEANVFIDQEKYVEDAIKVLPTLGFTVKRDKRNSNRCGWGVEGWTISW